MKKALTWLGIFLGFVVLGTIMTYGIPFLFTALLVKGMEYEWDALNDRAEAALAETGLNAYIEYAPNDVLTLADSLTAFVLPRYDNHVDNTDLHAGVMAQAAVTDGWTICETSADDYLQLLEDTSPQASFLLPADTTFDALYQSGNLLAFFDQDTGLMVSLQSVSQPEAGSIRMEGLSIPHDGYVYEVETHGGFHGDGTTYQALIVPAENRAELEGSLSVHADWHEGSITCQEYRQLHELFYEVPAFCPSDDVTFDWFCWVDTYARQYPDENKAVWNTEAFPAAMQEIGAGCSGNWLVILYDVDTGLLVFYEYDS